MQILPHATGEKKKERKKLKDLTFYCMPSDANPSNATGEKKKERKKLKDLTFYCMPSDANPSSCDR